MGNEAHGAIVYMGYGVQGYRPHGPWGLWAMGAQGVWGTWAIGALVNRATESMGTRGMGNGVLGSMGNGAQGYGPHRQWVTWAMEYRGMGHMGNEAHWGYRVQGYGAHGQ